MPSPVIILKYIISVRALVVTRTINSSTIALGHNLVVEFLRYRLPYHFVGRRKLPSFID